MCDQFSGLGGSDLPFRFDRLSNIAPEILLEQLRDTRVARHLPLLPADPDLFLVKRLVAAKEAAWEESELGHWAILQLNDYVGWGGFQREKDEWDFGLVLRSEYFRCGKAIARQAFAWARDHTPIEEVTFLLPLTRSDRALVRFGARPLGVVEHSGRPFRKWIFNLRSNRIGP